MSDNDVIRVKYANGDLLFEFEGPEPLLGSCMKRLGLGTDGNLEPDHVPERPPIFSVEALGDLSTNSIAIILKVKTGRELIMAAAARLGIILGKEEFLQSEITGEMAQTNFYKRSHYSNFQTYAKKLTESGQLHLVRKGVFRLSSKSQKQLLEILSRKSLN